MLWDHCRWAIEDSNLRPLPCRGSALTTELIARKIDTIAQDAPSLGAVPNHGTNHETLEKRVFSPINLLTLVKEAPMERGSETDRSLGTEHSRFTNTLIRQHLAQRRLQKCPTHSSPKNRATMTIKALIAATRWRIFLPSISV